MASWKQGKIKFGFLETATSGGTLTLTFTSLQYQILTGSANHTVVLPDATTLVNGTGIAFSIVNVSTGTITVKLNDTTTTLITLASGQGAAIYLKDNSTSNGIWVPKTGGAPAAAGIVSVAPGGVISALATALSAGGSTASVNTTIIEYFLIATLGNAATFGNLTALANGGCGCASSTRAIFSGKNFAATSIDYVQFATQGNAANFGSIATAREFPGAHGNAVRGLNVVGGNTTSGAGGSTASMEYVTIATLSNGTSFGNLTLGRDLPSGCSSPTRGIASGGYTASVQSTIDYVTIATTGNATSFGTLTTARYGTGSASSRVRGVIGGGDTNGLGAVSVIMDYITIATTGNATSFGSLSVARTETSATSDSSRGVWNGGTTSGSTRTNQIEYITIATTGNAANFGTLGSARRWPATCSNAHGGL